MKKKIPFAKFVLTLAIIIAFNATSPQVANANNGWRTLVGSWFVEVTPGPGGPPPFANLATLNWPGTIITSDPVFGAGHGVWKRVGPGEFDIKFVTLIPANNPAGLPPNSILTVTATMTVDDSGDEASGISTGVFTDSAGNVLAVSAGPTTFTRIELD